MENSIDIINIVIESEECNGRALLLNLIECEMEKEKCLGKNVLEPLSTILLMT